MLWPAATLSAWRYRSASRVSRVKAKLRTTRSSVWPGTPGKFAESANVVVPELPVVVLLLLPPPPQPASRIAAAEPSPAALMRARNARRLTGSRKTFSDIVDNSF